MQGSKCTEYEECPSNVNTDPDYFDVTDDDVVAA